MKILLVNYKYVYDRSWNNLNRRAANYYLEYLPPKADAKKTLLADGEAITLRLATVFGISPTGFGRRFLRMRI